MERRGKKLLSPRAVAAVSDVEGQLAATAALLETGNAMVRARAERGTGVDVEGKRERMKLLRI